MAVKIVIDAGHGGYDAGATYNGRREKDDTLALALAVGEILEAQGYDVVYTRTDDVYDSPVQKARIGNESGADFIRILKRDTRHFAKRQLTWFRRERDVIWLDKDILNTDQKLEDAIMTHLAEKNIR